MAEVLDRGRGNDNEIIYPGRKLRDIKRIVTDWYGKYLISLTTINRISNKFLEVVKEFHERKIEKEYKVIWLDGLYFPLKAKRWDKKRKKGKNFCVLVALGLEKHSNKKEIIDYKLAEEETENNYIDFVESLMRRGLKIGSVEVIVHHGDRAIKSALEFLFGDKVKQQDCIFHKLQNIGNAVKNKSNKRKILKDASNVYKANNYYEYLQGKKEFIMKYKRKGPFAVEVFRRDDFIKTKFTLDEHLYHWISTTSAIDRTFREIRRRTNIIGSFENERSLDKILFFVINFINQLMGNAFFN